MKRYILLLAVCVIWIQATLSHSNINIQPLQRIEREAENYKTVIDIYEAPWCVTILNMFGALVCTGSIITSKVILTVAHCLDQYSASDLSVRVGSTNIVDGGQKIKIASFLLHENYIEDSYNDDIGIIYLAEVITTSLAYPIALPFEGQTVKDGALAINYGWGFTSDESILPSEDLQAVELFIINHDECTQKYWNIINMTEDMVCAGVLEGQRGPCYGSVGGPLMVDGILVGIYSWSYNSSCVTSDHPLGYTKVSNYVEWLISNL